MKIDNTIRTTIDPNLKKAALLNDVCFAEAVRIGIKVLLKRQEGLAGLMNEEKKILNQLEMLNIKLDIVRKEIKDLKQKEVEKEDLKQKEKELEAEKLYDAVRMNNPMRRGVND